MTSHPFPEDVVEDTKLADTKEPEWRLWPPSPKMQIVLIAAGFALFNFMLLGIWALVMIYKY